MNAVIGLSFNKVMYRKAMQFLFRFFVKPEMFDGLSDQLRAVAGHSTIDRLHLISARTLVITGTEDRIIPWQSSATLASRIPNAKLVLVKGGSHAFNVDMASRFKREVWDFLGAASVGHGLAVGDCTCHDPKWRRWQARVTPLTGIRQPSPRDPLLENRDLACCHSGFGA